MIKKMHLPILLHEDTEAYQTSITIFEKLTFPRINDIKTLYNKMGLKEPFSDEIWTDLLKGGSKVRIAYEVRIEAVKDFLGINAGLVNESVINSDNSNAFYELQNIVKSLRNSFNSYSISFPMIEGVINVATKPELSPESKAAHLEKFRVYLNTEDDLRMKDELEAFAKAYNKFAESLNPSGFWSRQTQPIFNGSMINGLYKEQKETGKPSQLSLNPDAFRYLAQVKAWS